MKKKELTFKKVKLGHCNLEGREEFYNFNRRYFLVILNEKQAKEASEYGMKVRRALTRGTNIPFIIVDVVYNLVPKFANPSINATMRGEKFSISFDEGTISFLDYVPILSADVTVKIVEVKNKIDNSSFIKAYLEKMTVKLSTKIDTKKAIMYAFGGKFPCKKEE